MANIVGPITVTPEHLEADNSYSENREEFRLLTSNQQAIQLQGLASTTNKENYGTVSNVHIDKGGWGIVPIDTSTPLRDNQDWTHRGYYLIDTVEPEVVGGGRIETKVAAEKVANGNDYLKMNFSRGVNDNTSLDFTYPPSIENVTNLVDDDFLTNTYKDADVPETGKYWTYGNSRRMNNAYIQISETSNLVMGGQASSDGTEGEVIWNSIGGFPYPHVVEWDFEIMATPTVANRYSRGVVWYSGGGPHPVQDLADIYSNAYYIRHNITSWYNGSYLETGVVTGNSISWKYKADLTTRHPRIKLEQLANGILTVWIDKSGGSNWTKIYGPTNTGFGSWWYPHYAIGFDTSSSSASTRTIRVDRFKIYQSSLSYGSRPNIIALPAHSSSFTLAATPAFTRASEEGEIPCYVNPTTPLYFKTATPTAFYNGAVKGYNSNYSDGSYAMITRNEEVLSPSKFYVKNGLIKLTTNASSATPIALSYFVSGYTNFQNIGIGGAINTIKPLLISPERQTYKINDTKWTLFRGKPFVKVEHPTTNLSYTLSTYYVHDSATATAPGSGAPISMGNTHYTNIYNNNGDAYRTQIIQLNPTTIFSDSIPMANISGIGWYNFYSPSYNSGGSIAAEFLVQPQTYIGAKTS